MVVTAPVPIPPRPADWNKTIEDLFAEMKAGLRKSVGTPELNWAREYSQSLIPDDVRYPRQGDVYEALMDTSVSYLTSWDAPYTGGGDATLFAGERVWIESAPGADRPVAVYAMPIDYTGIEARMVPESERTAPKYRGFYLSIDTNVLLNKFNFRYLEVRTKTKRIPAIAGT